MTIEQNSAVFMQKMQNTLVLYLFYRRFEVNMNLLPIPRIFLSSGTYVP